MDYDDQDDYNSYTSGSADYSGEDWDKAGFSVEDASSLSEDGDEAADAFFAGFTKEDPLSKNPGEGMATTKTMLLGRLEGMGDSQKVAHRKILDGSLDPTKYGLAEDTFAKAAVEFNSVTGLPAADYYNEIHAVEATPVTHLRAMGRDLKVPRTIQPTVSKSDMSMALSMLGNTSGSYLAEGPGTKLQGIHVGNEERRRKEENDLEQAFDNVAELTDLYIRQATKDNTQAYEQRFYDVNEALTERLMQGHFRRPDDRGPDRALLPLPNDVSMGTRRITGLVPTMNNGGMSTDLTYRDYTMIRDDEGVTGKDIPNLRKSLFGDVPKTDSYNLLADAYEKAEFASAVFRKQFPTNRDDSARQIRHAAFDTPYGEQTEAQDARNEGAILDKDTYQGLFEQGSEVSFGPNVMLDTKSGGIYGEKESSEREDFVRELLDPSDPDEELYNPALVRLGGSSQAIMAGNRTDQQRYQYETRMRTNHKQGSPEWHAQRKGKVTASVAEELLRKSLDKAVNTVLHGSSFKGNSYSKDGTDSEGETLASFLGSDGKGLSYEEAYFEEGKGELAGLAGVSPDGRLYNPDGSSAGLLELKYLTDKSAKTSFAKHNKQMQMQMLITGETQTHYFVRSSDTGIKARYDLVQADPHMQEQLRANIIETQLRANNMTPEEAEAMAHSMRPKKVTSQAESTLAGQEVMYQTMTNQPVAAAEPYRPRAVGAGTVLRSPVASGSAGEGSGGTPPPTTTEVAVDPDEFNNALDESAGKIREFGNGLAKAIKNLGTLGSLATSGTDTAMADERLGANTGLEAGAIRGMRDILVNGGMTEGGATSVMGAAGQLQNTMNNELTAPGRYTDMLGMQGASNLPGVRSLQMPGYASMQGQDAQALMSTALAQMDGKTREERSYIAKMWGMPELAVTSASSTAIGEAFDRDIDASGARSQYEGVTDVRQEARDALEIPGTVGYEAGIAAEGATTMSTAAKVLAGFGIGGGASMATAKGRAAIGRAASSTMSKFPKAGPLAIAAMPTALRGLIGVEDDGGWADSILDVAEFTGLGAASGIPGGARGIATGAMLGLGAGVANETHEFFSNRINPSPDVTPVMDNIAKANVKVDNNINVDVNVAEDMVTTSVDNNGDFEESVDTLNTGG